MPSGAEFTRARPRRLGTIRIPLFCARVALLFQRLPAALRVVAWVVASLVADGAAAFDLEGHRGARGLAPENTLAAFRRALEIGVSTLETDMAVTQDGVIVISHEPFLNPDLVRGPDGHWLAAPGPPIHALTLEQLRRYDIGRIDPSSKYARQFPQQQPADGERFPQLTEVFDLVKSSGKPVRLNIETKITPDERHRYPDPGIRRARGCTGASREHERSGDGAILRLAPADRSQAPRPDRNSCLTIQTSNDETIRVTAPDGAHRRGAPDSRCAHFGGSLPALVKAAGCATWSMFWRNLNVKDVAAAHALGLKVLPWTVNDRRHGRLIDLGVDGIITDYPGPLRRAGG